MCADEFSCVLYHLQMAVSRVTCMKLAPSQSVAGAQATYSRQATWWQRRTRMQPSPWPACPRSGCTWPSTPAAPAPPAARWVTLKFPQSRLHQAKPPHACLQLHLLGNRAQGSGHQRAQASKPRLSTIRRCALHDACTQAALNLVADLMEHNTTCFREGVELLLRIHFTQPYNDTVWGLPPATVARCARAGYQEPLVLGMPQEVGQARQGTVNTHILHLQRRLFLALASLLVHQCWHDAVSLVALLAAQES